MAISKKTISSAHASLDDLASTNPELFSAIVQILDTVTASSESITVSSAKSVRSKRKEVEVEEDDDDLAPAAKSTGRAKKKPSAEPEDEDDDLEEDDDEDDEDGDIELPTLEELTAEGIMAFIEELEEVPVHEEVASSGIRELRTLITEYGLDPSAIEEGSNRAEKTESLRVFASQILLARDTIAEFEIKDIKAVYKDETGEICKTRDVTEAASLLLKVVFSTTEEDEEGDEE